MTQATHIKMFRSLRENRGDSPYLGSGQAIPTIGVELVVIFKNQL